MTKDKLIEKLEAIREQLADDAIKYDNRDAFYYRTIGWETVQYPVKAVLIGLWNDEFQSLDRPDVFAAGLTEDGYAVFVYREDVGLVSAMEYLNEVLEELDPA